MDDTRACRAFTARAEFGDAYLFSSRDTEVIPKGLVCGRAKRALDNYVENLAPFVALALALIVTQHAQARRHDHWPNNPPPVYLLGIVYVRTGAWAVSIIGLLMMLWRLAGY